VGFSLGVLKQEEMVHGAAPGVVVGRLARQGLGLVRNRLNCFYNGAAAAAAVAEEPLPRALYVNQHAAFLTCICLCLQFFSMGFEEPELVDIFLKWVLKNLKGWIAWWGVGTRKRTWRGGA